MHPSDRNALHCLTCDTTIESVHRHDYKRCNCPPGTGTEVAVDGGQEYSRVLLGRAARWRLLEDIEPSQSMSSVNLTPDKDPRTPSLPGMRLSDEHYY